MTIYSLKWRVLVVAEGYQFIGALYKWNLCGKPIINTSICLVIYTFQSENIHIPVFDLSTLVRQAFLLLSFHKWRNSETRVWELHKIIQLSKTCWNNRISHGKKRYLILTSHKMNQTQILLVRTKTINFHRKKQK